MADDLELQAERDNDLIIYMALRTREFRWCVLNWAELVIKDLNIKFPILIALYSQNEKIHSYLLLKYRRLEEISLHEIPRHIEYIEDTFNMLKGGASDDLITDFHQFDDCINLLRGLVRELSDIRKYVNELPPEQE